MRVTLLGTGSALPSAERVQSGIAIETDDRTLLVDCGSGVFHRLAAAGIDLADIDTVLLTHLHLDHVADLSTIAKARWLTDRGELTVVGPPDTRSVLASLFRIDDLDERVDLDVRELSPGSFTCAGFDVEALETRHPAQCFAYRFGDTLAISGDTEPFDDLAAFVDGVSVLVHECSYPDGVDTSGHTTPTPLGETLADRKFDRLYLTHLFPGTEERTDELRTTVAERVDCEVTVGTDLTAIEIGEGDTSASP